MQYIVHKDRMKLVGTVQHCVGDQQDTTAVSLAVKPLKMNSLKKRLEKGRGLEGVSWDNRLWATNRGTKWMAESWGQQKS